MIKHTPDRQLIHAGPGCVATKAAGITKALTKGGCLWYWKQLLSLRGKQSSGSIVSPTDGRHHRNLVRC
jgi:hypothetical protein